jgi:predicted glycogen debranching enzyme
MCGHAFGITSIPPTASVAQGAPGYQLTWMDAKVDDWVVTPRRGKAVEINALWFNALKLMEDGPGITTITPRTYRDRAEQVRRSFNERFWYAEAAISMIVVDGEAGRPTRSAGPTRFSRSRCRIRCCWSIGGKR